MSTGVSVYAWLAQLVDRRSRNWLVPVCLTAVLYIDWSSSIGVSLTLTLVNSQEFTRTTLLSCTLRSGSCFDTICSIHPPACPYWILVNKKMLILTDCTKLGPRIVTNSLKPASPIWKTASCIQFHSVPHAHIRVLQCRGGYMKLSLGLKKLVWSCMLQRGYQGSRNQSQCKPTLRIEWNLTKP